MVGSWPVISMMKMPAPGINMRVPALGPAAGVEQLRALLPEMKRISSGGTNLAKKVALCWKRP